MFGVSRMTLLVVAKFCIKSIRLEDGPPPCRGQLGHGTLASEVTPRLVMALDGMKVKKVCVLYLQTTVCHAVGFFFYHVCINSYFYKVFWIRIRIGSGSGLDPYSGALYRSGSTHVNIG